MFILRRITSENAEINTILGVNYALILEERNKENFTASLEATKCDKKDVYGFVSYFDGKLIPLYKKSLYFIMVGDGQTFANITLK
jgi:hypothetical protein